MKRRSNGEGSYRRLPSGNWSGQIMIGYTDEGKRKIKTFTAPTKTEVQQKIRQFLEEQAAAAAAAKNVSFSDWADIWYAGHKTQVEESTYWNYGFTLNTLKAHFGDRAIQDIKQLDINRFIDGLLALGRSKSTIGKCKSMLVQIFALAEDNDLITKNPAIRAKTVRADKTRSSDREAFSPEEVELIKQHAPDDLMGNSIVALIGTGLRVQELLALTRDDIAEDGSMITVSKAVKMAYRKPKLGPPKSRKSNRKIPVAKEFQPYVKYLRDHGGEQFIWTSDRENGLYTVEEFRNHYNRILKAIPGVSYHSPHCCRHTYITTLQAKQVPMDIISVLAGHEDTTTTLGYTHITIDTLRKIIDSLDGNSTDSKNGGAA